MYLQLVEGNVASRYPWLIPQFHTDTLQALISRSYPSLEWALSSPPKPHAFVSLPLQSATILDHLVEPLDDDHRFETIDFLYNSKLLPSLVIKLLPVYRSSDSLEYSISVCHACFFLLFRKYGKEQLSDTNTIFIADAGLSMEDQNYLRNLLEKYGYGSDLTTFNHTKIENIKRKLLNL